MINLISQRQKAADKFPRNKKKNLLGRKKKLRSNRRLIKTVVKQETEHLWGDSLPTQFSSPQIPNDPQTQKEHFPANLSNEPVQLKSQPIFENQHEPIQANLELESSPKASNDSQEIVELDVPDSVSATFDVKEISNFEVIQPNVNSEANESSSNLPDQPIVPKIPPKNEILPETGNSFKAETTSPWETLGKQSKLPEKAKPKPKKLKFTQRKLKKKRIPRKPIKTEDLNIFKDLEHFPENPTHPPIPNKFNPLRGNDNEIQPDIEFTIEATPAQKSPFAKSLNKPTESAWQPPKKTPEKCDYVIGREK